MVDRYIRPVAAAPPMPDALRETAGAPRAERLPTLPPAGLRSGRRRRPTSRAIDRLQLAAFDDPQLPPLIAAIRASPNYLPELALVAELGGEVVGQIMVSRLPLVTDDGRRVAILVLSPLGSTRRTRTRGSGGADAGVARDRRRRPSR
jgi:hypothetical protein